MIGTYSRIVRRAFIASSTLALIAVAGCRDTSKEVEQTGYRGTGQVQITYASTAESIRAENVVP